MAFPGIFRRLFANAGAGPLLRSDIVPVRYELGEFYYFRHPTLKTGFAACQGGLISSAATAYPDIWAYLATTEGAKLCTTETEWQTMSTATWATLADGTTVGWEGIGGVPYYVRNTSTGTLRLPDLRGMYAEASGFDSLGVGGVHGWAIPELKGNTAYQATSTYESGAFVAGTDNQVYNMPGGYHAAKCLKFKASAVVPVASRTQVPSWGALACAFLGTPVAS